MPLKQDGNRHGFQARTGRREKLAPSRRPQPVAKADHRRKVHRRHRSRQPTAWKAKGEDILRKIDAARQALAALQPASNAIQRRHTRPSSSRWFIALIEEAEKL